MQPITVDKIQLEYDDRGSGEPIVFIHGSVLADAFAPLLGEPALTERYRRISYHRRGFAASTHLDRSASIAVQARDCRRLMRQIGVARAHVVGYSYGGTIALQLALDSPDVVHSLALFEPALLAVPSGAKFARAMGTALQLYGTGNKVGAVDAFLLLVFGKGYRCWLDEVLPGAFARAAADADTFFRHEFPALQRWIFTATEARSITQAVLLVLGANSASVAPILGEGHQLLGDWLPQAERFVLPHATHGLQLQNPRGTAEGLAVFLSHHPLAGV